MAPHPKIYDAFIAMEALGIHAEVLKPVLKNMLRLYNNNWELIEAENYRALVEAVFEQEEPQLLDGKRKPDFEQDGSMSPCKKLHSGKLDGQCSSHVDISRTFTSKKEAVEGNKKGLKRGQDGCKTASGRPPPGEHNERVLSSVDKSRARSPIENDRIPSNTSSKIGMDSFQPSLAPRKFQSISSLPHEQCNNTEKNIISSHLTLREKTLHSERESVVKHMNDSRHDKYSASSMATKTHKDNFINPGTEKLSGRATYYAGFSSNVHSGALVASSSGNSCTKSLTHQHINSEKEDDGSARNCSTNCYSPFHIASSPLGEVKVSLNCNYVLGQPNFCVPDLDKVLKHLENKYLLSYNTVGPEFSVKKLLKDLCISYLEMGTGSINKSATAKSSPRISATQPSRESSNIDGPAQGINIKCSGSSKSRSAENSHQQDKDQQVSCIRDITNGLEKMEISLVDKTGKEPVPKFVYIPQNTLYQNAYVHISLARIGDEDCCSGCSGNCLSSSLPCACARVSGGEFAYTPQGLLKEEFLSACISMNSEPQNHHLIYCEPVERCKNEIVPGPCKGHLVRKFIKECWRKCGCHLRCGNRVIQRGITCKLQVFLTHGGKGWGVRALEDMPKGAFVCEYVGEILTNTELYWRNKQSNGNERHTYPVLLDADWGAEEILNDEEALCLDATYYGNVARFINHRCSDSNLIEIPVEVETPDHHYYHIAFFTKREVPAMEELTWDYGLDFFDEDHPVHAFQCCCESAFCRGITQK